jgi:hypothetical protein
MRGSDLCEAQCLAGPVEGQPLAVQMAKQAMDVGDAYAAVEEISSAAAAFTKTRTKASHLSLKTRPALARDLNPSSTND